MNAQEIFDTVATHLTTQVKRSMSRDDGTVCGYRGEDDLKCAVGVLIPDVMYHPNMEFKGVRGLLSSADRYEYKVPDYFEGNVDLLEALQSVHDQNYVESKEHLVTGLTEIARSHGLTYTQVTA